MRGMRRSGNWIGAIVLVIGCPASGRGDDVHPEAPLDVYESGQDGYHTYRIPALITTQKGTLLAFCEGRKTSRADHGDIDLVLKRSEDGGRSWSPMWVVYEEGDTRPITIGNPCPVIDAHSGTIWLPFCRDNRDVLVTHSRDDGLTWSAPVEITASVKRPGWGWYATGPGVGVQLRHGPHAGRLVIPCDHSEPVDGRPVKHSHVFFSDDRGQTWRLGGSVGPHTDECQLAELDDGRLLVNMRNYWGRDGNVPDRGQMRATAQSADGGQTWGPLKFEIALIEPVCQASLIRYDCDSSRPRLVFSNPASRQSRRLLTVRLSNDEGRTWPVSRSV